MSLSSAEKEVLNSFADGNMMTLKMIATRIKESNHKMSRQSVWYALQLLVARGTIEKVDRGVYKKV